MVGQLIEKEIEHNVKFLQKTFSNLYGEFSVQIVKKIFKNSIQVSFVQRSAKCFRQSVVPLVCV